MPMFVNTQKPTRGEPAESKAETQAEPVTETTDSEKAEAVAEAEKVIKTSKPKRKHKAKEPVAVA